jgi:hypothetical protein
MPIAILVGVEGSRPRLSSHCQKKTSGKVSVMTQNGLMAFEMIPPEASAVSGEKKAVQSVLRSAQYVSVEPFW